jgi:hypothetical protein
LKKDFHNPLEFNACRAYVPLGNTLLIGGNHAAPAQLDFSVQVLTPQLAADALVAFL